METVPDTFPSLFWGYAVIWCLLGAYIVSLGFRLRRLERK
ncbi:MAG: CcmD family protein [Oligoflexia bacterium]|nr:CcmD family protein [Oligoflexia bacterium]